MMPLRRLSGTQRCEANREETCLAAAATGRVHRFWLRLGLLAALLLTIAPLAWATVEPPAEPFEEIEAFVVGSAAGSLVLPAGAPDRQTPAVVILPDGDGPDGRASLYTDQLLGAGFAVLEILDLPDGDLEAVLIALARHPRVAGQPLGLLGFGAGARLIASLAAPVAARALLYPGCEGVVPVAMDGEAVMLMHGAADPINEAGACETLGAALTRAGAAVRLRVLARATYAWDRPAFSVEGSSMLIRPDGLGRVRAKAWPELAALSAAEVAGFFARSFYRSAR